MAVHSLEELGVSLGIDSDSILSDSEEPSDDIAAASWAIAASCTWLGANAKRLVLAFPIETLKEEGEGVVPLGVGAGGWRGVAEVAVKALAKSFARAFSASCARTAKLIPAKLLKVEVGVEAPDPPGVRMGP